MSKDEHNMESNINANSKTTKFSSLTIKGISCLLIIITVFGVLFLVSEDTGVIRNEFLDVPVHSDESTTPENIKIIHIMATTRILYEFKVRLIHFVQSRSRFVNRLILVDSFYSKDILKIIVRH